MDKTPKRTERKRTAVLTAAAEVFLRDGFGGASMDRIIAAAAVSTRTAYRHFPNKESLFEAVVIDACDKSVVSPLEVDPEPEDDPEAVLTAFAEKFMKLMMRPDVMSLYRIMLAEATRFPELSRIYYEAAPRSVIVPLQGYFERQMKLKRFAISDPRLAAEQFIEMVRGHVHLRAMLCIPQPGIRALTRKSIQQAVSIFLHGVINR